MIRLERILLPTDFSEFSKPAEKYACALAEQFDSELHLLHVLQDLIAQQIALRNLIQLQIRPAYTQQLNQLRATIETYNAQCTTRPRYVLDVEKAQQNLVCPNP
jgi:nucleotide-binding universal stress UspA family protein